jgi:hypothetical protein
MVRGKQTIYSMQLRLVDRFLTRADTKVSSPFVDDPANFGVGTLQFQLS